MCPRVEEEHDGCSRNTILLREGDRERACDWQSERRRRRWKGGALRTVEFATRLLLTRCLSKIRAHQRTFPRSEAPRSRRHPTAKAFWARYLTSMITAQQRSSEVFWQGINADARWRALRNGGARNCPRESTLVRILSENRVRFPQQKAERLRLGASKDFEQIAAAARLVLRERHDAGARRAARRAAEVELAELIQHQLRGCGVAPKVARLMMKLPDGDFEHVVPIDSRWQGALESVGSAIEPASLAKESTYRAIEDQIVRAAYALRVEPLLADGAIFGWLDWGKKEEP